MARPKLASISDLFATDRRVEYLPELEAHQVALFQPGQRFETFVEGYAVALLVVGHGDALAETEALTFVRARGHRGGVLEPGHWRGVGCGSGL